MNKEKASKGEIIAITATPNQGYSLSKIYLNDEEIIGLDTWDMSNAISIKGMFRNCKKLKDISGIYNWNISKITVIPTA